MVQFNQLRRFVGGGISEENLIRKFLDGMRVDIRNRCRVVTYYILGDLVEKATEQEAGLAESRNFSNQLSLSLKRLHSLRRGRGTNKRHRVVLFVIVTIIKSE